MTKEIVSDLSIEEVRERLGRAFQSMYKENAGELLRELEETTDEDARRALRGVSRLLETVKRTMTFH